MFAQNTVPEIDWKKQGPIYGLFSFLGNSLFRLIDGSHSNLTTNLTCRYEAQRNSGRRSALLGLVIMFQSYDYISIFVSFVDIAMSLDNLFKWIASIDDRFYLSRLNKLFKED